MSAHQNGVTPLNTVLVLTSFKHAREHEHVEPDRRGDQADLGHHHRDDAEPDQDRLLAQPGIAEPLHHGEEDRDGQEQHRQALEHAAEHEIDREDDDDHHQRRQLVAGHQREQPRRQPAPVDEVGEDQRPDQHGEQHRRGARRVGQHLQQRPPGERAARERDQERAARPDAGRLGRGEQPAVDAAHHQDEEDQRPPHAPERGEAAGPVGALGPGPVPRAPPDHPLDGGEVKEDPRQPGNEAGGEQLADAGLGHQPVDHQDHARRDQDAERAPGGDRGRGEAVGIAVAAHRRHGDLGHRRRGREAGSADRREPAAGDDGRHRQAAAPVAEKGVARAVELARKPRAGDQVAHQDEQRHHGQAVGERRLGDQRPHHR